MPQLPLTEHIAHSNHLFKIHDTSTEILLIFQWFNGYISPSWYATKQQDHKPVPTWNYAFVHIYGILTFIEDTYWLKNELKKITIQQEQQYLY